MIPVAVRSCDQCRLSNVCKFKDERIVELSEIAKKTEKYFGALPEWIAFQKSQVLIHCADYLYKYSEYHCRNCVHLTSNPSFVRRGSATAEQSYKYKCAKNKGWFSSGNSNPCEDFERGSHD